LPQLDQIAGAAKFASLNTDFKDSPAFRDSHDEEDEDEDVYKEINSRRNVYDNDDFDIFHKDQIDISKIHLGKRYKRPICDLWLSLYLIVLKKSQTLKKRH
jgi:hypothetical protein